MKLAYINISRSNSNDVVHLKKRQLHTILYKQQLSESAEVHYLLRNSASFADHSSGLHVIAKDLSVPQFLWFVFRYLTNNRIKVVIVHSLNYFLYVPMFKLIPGLKLIMQHHGEVLYRHKKSILLRFIDPLVDAYFFQGQGNATPFVARGCIKMRKVFEVPEGTTSFKTAGPPVGQVKNLVFIGRLDDNKNLITLLKALVILREQHLILDIYFAEGSLLQVLQAFCVDNHIDNKVRFMGKIPADRMETVLQQADIFVSCSKYEAGGYSLIEALACGVYPVVTRIPSFDFALRGLEYKRQFSAENEKELALCLNEILKLNIDGKVRHDIRIHFEKRFSPEAIALTILDAIKFLQKG